MTTSDSILAAAGGDTAPGTMSESATTDPMILAALDKLDPANDDHWTTTGKPAMEAVNALLPAAITRARLDEVAPNFSRPEAPADTGGSPLNDGVALTAVAHPGSRDLNPESLEEAEVDIPDDPRDARIAALEADLAYLRKQFGWPTKDA